MESNSNTLRKLIDTVILNAEEQGTYEFTSSSLAADAGLQDEYKASPAKFGRFVSQAVKYLQQEGYEIEMVAKTPKAKYKVEYGMDKEEEKPKGYTADEKLDGDINTIRKMLKNGMRKAEDMNTKAFGVIPKKASKTLVVSDLHIPFELQGIDNLVSSLSNDFDTLIINGDFLDTYSMSTFSKEADIPLYTEVQRGMEYLARWVGLFDKVIFNKGNHEMRIENYIGKNDKINRLQFMMDFDVISFMVKEMQLHAMYENYDNPKKQMEEMANMVDKIVYTRSTALKYGDAIIAHPTTFSSVPSRTITYAVDHYYSRIKQLRAVIIGHTHHVAKIVRNGVLGIESGCLCGTLPYELKGNIRLTRPTTGFVTLIQYDGITDVNATNYFVLDDHVIREENVVEI